MRYKKQSRNGHHRLRLPLLDGGLNAAVDASVMEDNELMDVCNLRMCNGVLTTRPALIGREGGNIAQLGMPWRESTLYNTIDQITRRPFEMDGELCIATIAARGYFDGSSYYADSRIVIMTLNGDVKASYTMPGMDPQAKPGMALIPVDAKKYNVPFFIYHYGHVFRPNGDVLELIPDEGLYAPLVMINGKGMSGTCAKANGVMFEGFNMLTDRYRAQFTTSVGSSNMSETFKMPTVLQSGSNVKVEVTTSKGVYTATATVDGEGMAFQQPNGEVDDNHTVTATSKGDVTIRYSFDKSDIANNVTITAKTGGNDGASRMKSPSCGTWFGGTSNRLGGTRVFLAGFRDGDRAKMIWSDLNNPLYFPENNYTFVGDLSQRLTALDKQEDMLVIFKERETYYTTYVEGNIDVQEVVEGTAVDVTAVQAYFPVTQLSPYIGCDCPNTIAVCRNRLVWMCADGRVYALASANQYSERNVREIGQKIRPRILAETTEAVRKAAYAADYNGEYWLLCGNTAYTFRYGAAGFVNLNSYASSSNAANAIVWFRHRFDGLDAATKSAIVSDGADRIVFIYTAAGRDDDQAGVYKGVRYIHIFGESDVDRKLIPDGNTGKTTWIETPIRSGLCTKTYTFGHAAFCRLKGVWLTAKAQGLTFSAVVDGKETTLPATIDSDALAAHFLPLPIKRCHRLALRMETTKPLILSTMEWHYTPFGYVK